MVRKTYYLIERKRKFTESTLKNAVMIDFTKVKEDGWSEYEFSAYRKSGKWIIKNKEYSSSQILDMMNNHLTKIQGLISDKKILSQYPQIQVTFFVTLLFILVLSSFSLGALNGSSFNSSANSPISQ